MSDANLLDNHMSEETEACARKYNVVVYLEI